MARKDPPQRIHEVEYNNYRGTRCKVSLNLDDKDCYFGNIDKIVTEKKEAYRKEVIKKPNFVMIDHPSYTALKFLLHIKQSRENEKLELFLGMRVLINYQSTERMVVFGTKPEN